MKIAFLLYPTAQVKVEEDTSFWIMHELERRGHEVFHFRSADLFWEGSPRVRLTRSRTHPKKGFLPSPPPRSSDLRALDCVFIRKEPPVDTDYLHALQILDAVKEDVFVLNDPAGLALCNEKIFILSFPDHIPETLVTGNTPEALSFARRLKSRIVLKNLDGKGGAGIFVSSGTDRNLPSLLEAATAAGRKKIMVQRFISADRHGDKRILLLNGEIIGSFVRRPPSVDFRANLGVGGSLHKAGPTTSKERKMAAEMAGELLRRGLYFVGIDVIGNRLTEINVTSPSGIADLRTLKEFGLEKKVCDFIECRSPSFGRKRFSA